MNSSSAPLSTPEGPGSVSGAPNLRAGFSGKEAVQAVADDLHSVVIPGTGHAAVAAVSAP
jgi:hypothetical protein